MRLIKFLVALIIVPILLLVIAIFMPIIILLPIIVLINPDCLTIGDK